MKLTPEDIAYLNSGAAQGDFMRRLGISDPGRYGNIAPVYRDGAIANISENGLATYDPADITGYRAQFDAAQLGDGSTRGQQMYQIDAEGNFVPQGEMSTFDRAIHPSTWYDEVTSPEFRMGMVGVGLAGAGAAGLLGAGAGAGAAEGAAAASTPEYLAAADAAGGMAPEFGTSAAYDAAVAGAPAVSQSPLQLASASMTDVPVQDIAGEYSMSSPDTTFDSWDYGQQPTDTTYDSWEYGNPDAYDPNASLNAADQSAGLNPNVNPNTPPVDASAISNATGIPLDKLQQPGVLERMWNWIKANPQEAMKLGLASIPIVQALAGGNRSGSASGAGGAAPRDDRPLIRQDFKRTYTPYAGDYRTYGQGPQHQFVNNPLRLAKGGLARAAEAMGSGRDDQIPARLSAGEYVMDAETMALLGDGSPDEGARRMDDLRRKVRAHKGKALAKGAISPNAKQPTQYLADGGMVGGCGDPKLTEWLGGQAGSGDPNPQYSPISRDRFGMPKIADPNQDMMPITSGPKFDEMQGLMGQRQDLMTSGSFSMPQMQTPQYAGGAFQAMQMSAPMQPPPAWPVPGVPGTAEPMSWKPQGSPFGFQGSAGVPSFITRRGFR